MMWGVYWGFVANLAASSLLHNLPFVSKPFHASTAVWLVTLGATNEIVGVLFIASPEIGRVLPGFLAKVRARVDVVVRRIQRWFERPRHIIVSPASAVGVADVGTPTIIITPGSGASLEERVNYLWGCDKEIRSHLHRVDSELERQPQQWREELDGVRTELESLQRELVRRVAEARIRLRLLGLAFVLLGIVLSWLGNVI
jgi:hypothetical protein